MKTVQFEGISFNVDSYGRQITEGLTEKQFIERGIAEGKYRRFKSAEQKKLLKEAYRLITAVS